MNPEKLEIEITPHPTTFEKHSTELNKHNFLEVISMSDGNFVISTGDVFDYAPVDASLNDLIEIRDMLNKIIQSDTEKRN